MSSGINITIENDDKRYSGKVTDGVLKFSHTTDRDIDSLEASVNLQSFSGMEFTTETKIRVCILLDKKVVKTFLLNSNYVKIVKGQTCHKVVALVKSLDVKKFCEIPKYE